MKEPLAPSLIEQSVIRAREKLEPLVIKINELSPLGVDSDYYDQRNMKSAPGSHTQEGAVYVAPVPPQSSIKIEHYE